VKQAPLVQQVLAVESLVLKQPVRQQQVLGEE
jgi:hypothetical protein